jgi:ABC-type sugar transport system permease subunit
LTNSLALIAPASSKIRLTIAPGFPLAPALGPNGRLAMGQVTSVPAGKYGRDALIALRVWPSVQARVAGADSVRSAMALVSRGEAPLGIVYATDARADKRVRVVGIFPANSHKPIVYPLARLATTIPMPKGSAASLPRRRARRYFAPMALAPNSISPEEWGIIWLSLKVSMAAMVVTLPIGFALAWALARGRFPGKVLLDGVVHLPLVLPPVVTGWLLLLTFGGQGWRGAGWRRWACRSCSAGPGRRWRHRSWRCR